MIQQVQSPVAQETGVVRSRDRVAIGYRRVGDGPPLVICHGAMTVGADWYGVADRLASQRTVFVYDRRGRGSSDDGGTPYSFEAEIDDLEAVMSAAGPGADLLGHSFGGACALMYTIRSGFSGRLILYDGVTSIPRPLSGGCLPAYRERLEAGDPDAATAYALEYLAGVPAAEIPPLRSSPLWPRLVGLRHVFYREMDALDGVIPSTERLSAIRARVSLLLGTRSFVDPFARCAAALVAAVPGVTLYPVAGEGHVAHLTNPDLLARLVVRCLGDS